MNSDRKRLVEKDNFYNMLVRENKANKSKKEKVAIQELKKRRVDGCIAETAGVNTT